MSEGVIENRLHKATLVTALGVVIGISIILVSISLYVFLESDAYRTVKQIQSGVRATAKSDLGDYDTTTPVKAENIDDFTKSINSQLEPINSEAGLKIPPVNFQSVGL